MGGALADDVELALQCVRDRDALAAPDEHLANHRLHLSDRLSQVGTVDRDVAPAEQNLSLVLDRAFDFVFAGEATRRFLRQEHHANAVLAERRQLDALLRHILPEQLVRKLHQYPGAVAAFGSAPDRAAVSQVAQNSQPLSDQRVRFLALDVRDESDAAGIVFVFRVVQAL